MARHRWIPLLAALAAACTEAPPPAPPPPLTADFSGERAFAHLEQLVGIGPRVAGEEGAELARAYIREQLGGLGLEVFEQEDEFESAAAETVQLRNLVGVIPGESTDLVVLAAPFDSQRFEELRFVGANDGASGAALLLELARNLAAKPLPYTTWLVFLEHEAPLDPDQDDLHGFLGSRLLVNELEASGRLDSVRIAIYFNQVADSELSLAKDLRSHRQYRIALFDAARRLGYGDAFAADSAFTSPAGGHIAFYASGFRRVLVVTDDRFGGDEPPGTFSHTEEDDLANCSPRSLEVVGRSTETALRDITATLAKIDRFARRPVVPDVEPALDLEPDPEPEEALERETPEAAAADGPAETPEEPEPAESPGEDAAPEAQVEPQATGPEAEASQAPADAFDLPVKTVGEAVDELASP